MNINTCVLSGNLTRDAELRSGRNGDDGGILTFTIASNERHRDQQTGEYTDYPNFFRCVIFGRRASDRLQSILHKGTKVCVKGHLHYSTYQDRQGNNRSSIEVYVDDLDILSSRNAQDESEQQAPAQQTRYGNRGNGGYAQQQAPDPAPQAPASGAQGDYDDDVPF